MVSAELADVIVASVKEYVGGVSRELGQRMDAIDALVATLPAGPKGEPGEPGRDADIAEVEQMVIRAVSALPAAKDGRDGKDAEPIHPDTLARLVSEEVRRQVDAIPRPRDGKDAAPLDLAWVEKLIRSELAIQVATLPKPVDGKDGEPGPCGPRGERGEDGAAGEPGPRGPEGTPGKDGVDGRSITDAEIMALVEPAVARAVDAIPRPRDGKDADHEVMRSMLAAEFSAMADELLRCLDEETAALPASPSLNVHVNAGDVKPRASNISAREQTVIGNAIAEKLCATLMLPVKPVFDERGKLLYGQRVASVE